MHKGRVWGWREGEKGKEQEISSKAEILSLLSEVLVSSSLGRQSKRGRGTSEHRQDFIPKLPGPPCSVEGSVTGQKEPCTEAWKVQALYQLPYLVDL